MKWDTDDTEKHGFPLTESTKPCSSVFFRVPQRVNCVSPKDIMAYDEAKKAVMGGEELLPAEMVYAILDGVNPVKVWREHRGLTQQQLAQAAGISVPYLSQIESGVRKGSTAVLSAIASALGVSLDDLT